MNVTAGADDITVSEVVLTAASYSVTAVTVATENKNVRSVDSSTESCAARTVLAVEEVARIDGDITLLRGNIKGCAGGVKVKE